MKQAGIPPKLHSVTSEMELATVPAACGLNTSDMPCKPMKVASVTTIAGMLSGIAGLILAGQVGIGSPATGIDYTLMSITAVVLGGTRIAGGRGSALSVLMGAALVQSLSSASSFINQDSAIHLTVLGAVTLVAATFFSVARRERTG